MLRRSLFVLGLTALSASLAFACGGSIGNGSTQPADGGTDSGGGDGSIGGAIEGSYDLTFGHVVVSMQQQVGTNVTPPSLSKAVRLDLRKRDDGTYDAVFTTRWGQSSAMKVDVTASAVTLTGQGAVQANDVFYVTDTYKSLVLARGADGALSGSVTATGEEDVSEGDYVITGQIDATGAIARDATAPELRATLTSPDGRGDVLLPWDPIRVDLAEPVDFDAVAKAFVLTTKGGDAIAIAWTKASGDPQNDAATAWAGATGALGTVTAWGDVLAPTLALAATPTIVDRVGHATSAYSASPSFLGLEQHQTTHDFDSDVVTVGSWGNPLFLGGFTGSDPNCEHGGCVEIGPFDNGVCGAPRIGVAGLIDAATASNVVVRYRVLFDDMGSGQPPPSYGAAFVVDTARPGVDKRSTQATTMSADVKQLATPMLGMSWATDWTTLRAPLPTGTSTVVGFTVRAGAYPGAGGCAGGPAPAPVKTIVLVDSVTVE
jgi:hypothetical protein